MATMKDVAEKAGVSTSTVSHVINDTRYVSPELRKKVENAMEELDYSPHAAARSLRAQKTYTIGFVASDITNTFFAKVVRGVERIAEEHDYKVIVANTDETAEKEVQHIKGLIHQERVDGLIIAPTGKNQKEFKNISDTPLVFVDRVISGVEAPSVLSANREGAYQAVNHLISKGHSKIGIVLGRKGVLTSKERFEGYKRALYQNGLSPDRSLISRGNFKVEGSFKATKELLSLDKPPTAIFTINNKTTMGALRAIRESKMDWPSDIEVAGFDDFDCLKFLDLPITTVIQKPGRMGMESAKLLFKSIEAGKVNQKTVRIGVEVDKAEAPR
ncbi:LacI family transcriptional regulator [Candidatus Bipolaricaulota bacterium]|nr:LacI family transcriptional regulator [Candidatus Bipolaricaulota bacterium]